MKYVHKWECAERGALTNVAREVEILSKLEHPFLVNLWFSFQGLQNFFLFILPILNFNREKEAKEKKGFF